MEKDLAWSGVVVILALAIVGCNRHAPPPVTPTGGATRSTATATQPVEPETNATADKPPAPAAAPPAYVSPTPAHERIVQSDGATRVYRHDFANAAPGLEWSEETVSRSKAGDRPYLGNINPGKPLTLTLKNLPPHKLVRFQCDLFLLRSWDGSSPIWGYNRWDMQLGDGRSLIHTTFGNCGFFSDNNEQAFPDSYPARPHPAWTGAAEHGTLGWMQFQNRFDASSVYHLDLTFPHTDADIVFSFLSTIEKDQRKYFGLTNVQVETLEKTKPLTQERLQECWKDLAHPHHTRFFKAQWDLIASGEQAVEFLQQHADEKADLPQGEIRKLVEQLTTAEGALASELFDQVVMQGQLAEKELQRALEAWLEHEQAERLKRALKLIQRYPETATESRLYRARRVLEAIHSPAAIELAKKFPAIEVREAKAP